MQLQLKETLAVCDNEKEREEEEDNDKESEKENENTLDEQHVEAEAIGQTQVDKPAEKPA